MINEQYTYAFPTNIRFGVGVIKELGPHLKEKGFKKPLIVTDPTLAELPFLKTICKNLEQSNLKPSIFHDVDKNPVKRNVITGTKHYKHEHCDCIVGIGGGASLDVARSIALKVNHDRDLFDYVEATGGDKLITNDVPYFVTVPTTSGTGSEVGRSSVISDDKTHQKHILFSPKLMASQVFADPELTHKLPAAITAATGMDALTHNIEAYLSKGFHPMCDGIALEGIRLVHESLVKATTKPDLESRTKMMAAALMGAVAFQKGLGVVHSTAHPLSTLKDLHHGLANAIMLPHCMDFNADVSGNRLTIIAKSIDLPNPSPETFISYLRTLNHQLDIPPTLSSVEVTESDIEPLSLLAIEDVCHPCNEKPVTLNDFKSIYRNAL